MSELARLIRFAVVAEELSFSRAARRLHVDQPWLSRQIQQLEMRLGFPLFVRSTRKVTLTPEGERLFEQAKKLAQVAEECQQVTRDMMRAHSLGLTVGVNPYTYWLPERKRILELFQARHERVNIQVVSNYSSRLVSKLRKRLIDVALIPEPFDQPDLEAMVIHSSPVGLLVPPEDPLARLSRAPLSALAGRSIPVVSERLNPAVWAARYGPFVQAGAVPVTIVEGEPAIPFYARDQRLPVVCVGWPHSDQGAFGDFVHVELEGPAPQARYALVRRREPPRGLLNDLWNIAAGIAVLQPA